MSLWGQDLWAPRHWCPGWPVHLDANVGLRGSPSGLVTVLWVTCALYAVALGVCVVHQLQDFSALAFCCGKMHVM